MTLPQFKQISAGKIFFREWEVLFCKIFAKTEMYSIKYIKCRGVCSPKNVTGINKAGCSLTDHHYILINSFNMKKIYIVVIFVCIGIRVGSDYLNLFLYTNYMSVSVIRYISHRITKTYSENVI